LELQQEFSVLCFLDSNPLLQQSLFVLVHLEFANVVDGGLQDGALVLPDVANEVIIPENGTASGRVARI
jgi:hypothetical protein